MKLADVKALARRGSRLLASAGERVGAVTATLGPFTFSLFPERQVHQAPAVAPPASCSPAAPSRCIRCGKIHPCP